MGRMVQLLEKLIKAKPNHITKAEAFKKTNNICILLRRFQRINDPRQVTVTGDDSLGLSNRFPPVTVTLDTYFLETALSAASAS